MQVKYYARACGRVQGVGFRYFVQYSAVALQIGGWVRNCEDGSVQMLLQGEEEAVQLLLQRIREGTVWIQVENLTVQYPDNDTVPQSGNFRSAIKSKILPQRRKVHAFAESCGQILLSFGQCRYTNRLRIMV